MKKLGIVVGHTNSGKGAFSKTLNVAEYTWNGIVARLMVRLGHPSMEIKDFYRDGVGISGAYAAADAWGADATIELHFNSSDSNKATGSGVLYVSDAGRRLASALQARIVATLGLPNWPGGSDGVVTPYEASGMAERGKTSLTAGASPAALVEPFFGSNPSDCAVAKTNRDAYAQCLIDGGWDFLKA